ncbi:hypothetical protein ACKWTF_013361 [Chironomus riparius]
MKGTFTFIIFALYLIHATNSTPVEKSRKACKNFCTDDDFDRMVCAYDGSDLRLFAGMCRMNLHNKCHQSNFKEVESSLCRQN